MLNTVKIALSAAALAATFGIAQAGINDDIDNCRAAINDAGILGNEAFTLRFVDDQGNRSRVLTLEAVVVGGNDKMIECRMSRSKVKEVAVVA